MTEQETIKILAMLGAFYGGGKTDPKAQVKAWHCILQKYDYKIAEKAVFDFAENDVRDYATFPAVGKIVQAIRNEYHRRNAPIKEIINAVSYGLGYDTLSDIAKQIVSPSKYAELLDVDAEEFQRNVDEYRNSLKRVVPQIEGETNGQ